MMDGQPPQGMRSVPPLATTASRVAMAGRGGDSTLIHVSPQELRGLASMAPNGRLPINPTTGLPEAGVLSAILGVVGGIGGSFIGMPWLGAGLGSFAGGLMEGKSLGSSLGMGVLGGIGAYGMGQAAGMLGSAGEGAASSAAAEMAKNGVTAAPLSDFSPAASAVSSGGAFGAGGDAALQPSLQTGMGSLGADGIAQRAVSQFAGNPTMVDAAGAAQNFSPTDAFATKAGNVLEGASDPKNLWNTFGTNYKSTTLPIAASLYGQATEGFGAFAAPKQGVPQGLQTAPQYPTLPPPNSRTYTPPPADWDYTHGREWNGWSPAFADGGEVRDKARFDKARGDFQGFMQPRPLPKSEDTGLTMREDALIKAIRERSPTEADGRAGFAMGGPISGPGGGLDDAIPAVINGRQPAKLSSGEYVVPAHAVSALGDGSTEAGVRGLDMMVNKVMQQKYGTRQPAPIRAGGLRSAGRGYADGGGVDGQQMAVLGERWEDGSGNTYESVGSKTPEDFNAEDYAGRYPMHWLDNEQGKASMGGKKYFRTLPPKTLERAKPGQPTPLEYMRLIQGFPTS